jgi:hypothetical protein
MKKILLFLILMFGSFASFAQAECNNAEAITLNGTITSPGIFGTYVISCDQTNADTALAPAAGNWYSYTPTQAGIVSLSSDLPQNVAPNSVDTRVSVWSGTCTSLVCEGGSDDVSPTNYLTTFSFDALPGVTYYIQWDDRWDAGGFDFSFTFTAVSCFPVYVFNASTNIATTSITLNWASSSSAPANYDVEYGPVGFVQGSGTTVSTATNSANLTGLTASTVYDFYVRSNCGTSQSTWSAVNSFSTAKVLPYTSNFDTGTSLIGWTIETNGPGGQQYNGTGTAGQAATPGYWFFGSSTAGANNNWLFSPAVSLQSGEQVTVSFYTRSSTSPRTLRVTVGSDKDSAMQTTQLAALNITAGTVWNLNTIPVYTAPAAGTYYFGFNDNSAATPTAVNMRLDTFSFTSNLVNVIAPSALSYNSPNVFTRNVAITNLNPTISGGAVTSYSISPALPSGLSLNTSTGVISGTPTAISAITTYTVTATNTGGSTSFGVVITVNNFANSQINSVAVVGEAAGGWPGSTGNPGPTDVHQMTSTDGENWTLSGLTLTTFAPDGGIKFRANNAWTINWGDVAFPSGTGSQGGANIRCIAGTYDVTFNSTTGAYNFSEVTTSFDQLTCATAAPITEDGTITCPAITTGTYVSTCALNGNTTNPNAVWFKYTATANGEVTINADLPQNVAPFSIPVSSGVTYYIAWDDRWETGGFDFDFSFAVPACIGAIATAVQEPTNITVDSAQLNWAVGIGNPASYDVLYGDAGFDPLLAGTVVNTVTNSLLLTGLTPASSEKDYYLRNNCGAEQSSYIGPFRAYLAKTLPYAQGFDDTTDPTDGFTATGGFTLTTSTTVGAAQSGTSYYFSNSSTTAATNAFLFSRAVALQANEEVTLTFYTRLGVATGTNHNLKVWVNGTPSAVGATQLGTDITISGATYTLQTRTFTATTAGTYYFIFNNATPIVTTVTSLRLDTVNITVQEFLNSDENQFKDISIYPNPFLDIINVNGSLLYSSFKIYSVDGKLIQEDAIIGSVINVKQVPSGIYFLKLSDKENRDKIFKVIKR